MPEAAGDYRPIIPPCRGYCRGARAMVEPVAVRKRNPRGGPPLFCPCCDDFLRWDAKGLADWLSREAAHPMDQHMERAVASCFHCQYVVLMHQPQARA